MEEIKFRRTDIPQGATLKIRDVSGNLCDVPIFSLGLKDKQELKKAVAFIWQNYQPKTFDVPLEMVLAVIYQSSYICTTSPSVGAYTGMMDDEKITILNRGMLYSADKKEIAVTVLHEAMHAFDPDDIDKASDSEDEAIHDVKCYIALNLIIPGDHWAVKKLGMDTLLTTK